MIVDIGSWTIDIMRYGRSDIDDEYFAIIKAEIEDFVDKVYNSIREFGYNLKTTPIVFVGGWAVGKEPTHKRI